MKSYKDYVLRSLTPLGYLEDFSSTERDEIYQDYNKYLIDGDNYVYEIPSEDIIELYSDEDYQLDYNVRDKKLFFSINGNLHDVYYVEPDAFFDNPDYYIKELISDAPSVNDDYDVMQTIFEGISEDIIDVEAEPPLEYEEDNDNEYQIRVDFDIVNADNIHPDDYKDIYDNVLDTLSNFSVYYYNYGQKVKLTSSYDNIDDSVILTIKSPIDMTNSDIEDAFNIYKSFMNDVIKDYEVEINQKTF